MKIVTICGSMKFQNKMIEIASELEKKLGWCVIQCVYNSAEDETFTKEEMDNIVNAHWKKINISDAIYVVNVGGYIGTSTKNEIEYALSKQKEVIYLEN